MWAWVVLPDRLWQTCPGATEQRTQASQAQQAVNKSGRTTMSVAGRHRGVCGVVVALTAVLVVWAVPAVLDTFDRSNLRISPAAVPIPTTAGPRASPAPPRAGGRVTAAEHETADRFIAFAKRPTANNLDQIKFADEVLLGLGPDIIRGTRTVTALADPPAWRLQPKSGYFRAAVGPFSAIDTLADAGAVRVTGGATPTAPVPRCPRPTRSRRCAESVFNPPAPTAASSGGQSTCSSPTPEASPR